MLLIDLFFPRRCPVCDCALPLGKMRICPSCKDKWKPVLEPICRKCGKQLLMEEMEYCQDCVKRKHLYTQGRALFPYQEVKSSLYRFKYQGRKEYAEYYGQIMAEHLGREMQTWAADCLIPVPLHRTRKRKRGYNQAEVLAVWLAKYLGIPVRCKAVKRVKKTKPLKMLSFPERQNNLKKAFKFCQNDVKLNTIIIVDDIYTTGSTIDALAEVLQEAGAKRIYFVTLAIGKG